MLKELKRIISNTCICFTVCEFILLIVSDLMLKGQATSNTAVSFLGLRGAVLVLITAFIFNILRYVFRIKSLQRVVVRLIHYALAMFCLLLVGVITPRRTEIRYVFVFLFLATIIYIVVSFIAFAIRKLTSKKAEEVQNYTSVFDGRQDS